MTRSRKVWAALALTALAVFGTVPRASADFTLGLTVDGSTASVYTSGGSVVTPTATYNPDGSATITLASGDTIGFASLPGSGPYASGNANGNSYKDVFSIGGSGLTFTVSNSQSQIAYNGPSSFNVSQDGIASAQSLGFSVLDNGSRGSQTGTPVTSGITQPNLTPLGLSSYIGMSVGLHPGQTISLTTMAEDVGGSNSTTTPIASLTGPTYGPQFVTTTATYNNNYPHNTFTPYDLTSNLTVTTNGQYQAIAFIAESTAYAPAPPSALLLGLGLFGAGAFARLRRRFSPVAAV